MITFEPSPAAVRPGETEIAGRRIVVRMLPYIGRVGQDPFGFDPVDRTIFRRSREGVVAVGPVRAESWSEALVRIPPGPALIGPGHDLGEPVWAAYAAAVEGARQAGRAIYLLDPPPGAFSGNASGEIAALLTWSPTAPVRGSLIEDLAARGAPAGCLLPVLPGWTSDHAAITKFVEQARQAGARFVAPVMPDGGGAARRAIVEARAEIAPDAAEQIFGRVHHADWDQELTDARALLSSACSAAGIETIPPRPVGRGESARNAAASARLEELAWACASNEHRAALLHAAARWIDESRRDLAAVAREGNLRRVFPYGGEIAAEIERALTGVPA